MPASETNERTNVMTQTTMRCEQAEQEFLVFEVSAEELETAAGSVSARAENYTLAACSGLSVCPA
jgi:hypothetical protein